MICQVCGQQMKRLTASHVKRHGLTMDDYKRRYMQRRYREEFLAAFLMKHYVSIKGRWVRYDFTKQSAFTIAPFEKKPDEKPVISDNPDEKKDRKRNWPLCQSDIVQHTEGRCGMGVYFGDYATKFIGLDVDTTDLDVLRRVYKSVVQLGIPEDSILCSFSGNKGYHVDILLSGYLQKTVVKRFYEVLLIEADVTEKQVELRGGGGQAYKLPFGWHYKTGNYCPATDENGVVIGDESIIDYLQTIKPAAPIVVCDAVSMNYSIVDDAAIEFQDLNESIRLLPKHSNTNAIEVESVEKLLQRGYHESTGRHNCILRVAAYLKDVKRLNLQQTIDFINDWVKRTWTANIVDIEVYRTIKDTSRSVYKTDYEFNAQAAKVTIHAPDIREIMSIEVGHVSKTAALRRLYFALLIHYRAYSHVRNDGTFFMTYEQLANMGAGCDRSAVYRNIQELVKMGKVQVVESGASANDKRAPYLKKPNTYHLVRFSTFEVDVPGFDLCFRPQRCKECLHAANCYLSGMNPDDENFVVCPEMEKAA